MEEGEYFAIETFGSTGTIRSRTRVSAYICKCMHLMERLIV